MNKHGSTLSNHFPKATGNPSMKNMQGLFHLEDILTHPKSNIIVQGNKSVRIYAPDGRGAFFNNNGREKNGSKHSIGYLNGFRLGHLTCS